VIDLDIRKFFDSVPWDLVVKAVGAVCDLPWVLLYVERWLKAPLAWADGSVQQRERGTPQGSAVSPVLANLFLHFAFDAWMSREFPGVVFERYVDDAVIHCASQAQAHQVLEALRERMSEVGLALHPEKTRIVYCKDSNRPGSFEHTAFTFLGYTFQPRGAPEGREDVHRLQPRDQQGRLDEDQCESAVLAAAQVHADDRTGPRTMDQPHRARLDELLRGVLPLRALSPPGAHQRLPDAVAAQEAQTAAGTRQGPRGVDQSGGRTAPLLRALEMGQLGTASLVIRTTRAV
jgi:RNA-directed DNA polymerase